MKALLRRAAVAILSVMLTLQAGTAAALAFGSASLSGKPLETADYVTVAKVTRTKAPVHIKALSSSKVTATLKQGEEYPIVSVAKYHYQIQLLGGKKGWIRKQYASARQAPRYVAAWTLGGNRVDASALDVVIPSWYRLNVKSVMTSAEDKSYTEWAHSGGKKVWAMLGNGFDMELTDRTLTSKTKRAQLVSKLTASAVKTGIDGINVDFENMKYENREEFVAFIGELRKSLSARGKVVSVDVTRENPDPVWSGSYDRAALGKAADYVIMMGYEEHYGTGGAAGSVASLPWVETGLKKLLQEVPAHKVILAVPFYTREWLVPTNGSKASGTDIYMKNVNRLIYEHRMTKKWDAQASQYYAEYRDAAGRHRMWVEDARSMTARWGLVKKYHIGGAAAWAAGQESPEIWSIFK